MTFLLLTVIAVVTPMSEPPTAEQTPTVWLTDERVAAIRDRVGSGTEPQASAFAAVKRRVGAALDHTPQPPERWHVPAFYGDKEGHREAKRVLLEDANLAYKAALLWRLTGKADYAELAARILTAWAGGVEQMSTAADSQLSFSYHFPPMILAASLLEPFDGWAAGDRAAFRAFVRDRAVPMNTMGRENNWGNWGVALVIVAAAYLDDDAMFDRAVERWKELTASQVAEDGRLHHEVGRNGGRSGLWYSNFSLLPQTFAAEVARVRGLDLYGYRSPDGRSLRQAYEKLAPWCLRPETFPYFDGDPQQLHGADAVSYFELLLPRWPDASARALVERERPMSARHGVPALTLTHGGLPAVVE